MSILVAMRPCRIALLVGTGAAAGACSLIVDTSSLSGGSIPSEGGSDVRVVGSDASVGPDADADAAAARCSDGQTDPSLVLYLPFDE